MCNFKSTKLFTLQVIKSESNKTNKTLLVIKQVLSCKYMTCFQHKQDLRPPQKMFCGDCNGDDISSNSNAIFYDKKVCGSENNKTSVPLRECFSLLISQHVHT